MQKSRDYGNPPSSGKREYKPARPSPSKYGAKSSEKRQGRPNENEAKPYQKQYGKKADYAEKPYAQKPKGAPQQAKPYEKKQDFKKRFEKPTKPEAKLPMPNENEAKPYQKQYGKKADYTEKPYAHKPKGAFQQAKPYEKKQGFKKPFEKPAKPEAKLPMPKAPEFENNADAASEDTLPYFLMGRNAVREAIKHGRSIDRILVVPEQDGSLKEIIGLAATRRIVVTETMRKRLDEMCMPFGHGGRPGNHQGIIAMVPDIEYSELEDILSYAKERGEPPFLLLLDEINDPHNLGSMLRSAACAGVHGVVLPKRRSASVTAAVAKASAGAVEYIKVAKVPNLTATIEELKKAGIWVAGASMQGEPMQKANLKGPLALVIGNEAKGISRLVALSCDFLVSIPMSGQMDSLNAAVAAALIMFEKNRQEAGI